MPQGLSFRVARIPVQVDPTIVLIAMVFGLGRRSGILLAAWVGIVLVSVLVHELGHAFAFRHYGQEPQILLAGMGGMTSGTGEPLPPRRDLVVSLAGPVTPVLALVIPGLFLLRSGFDLGRDLDAVLADLVFANIAWTVLNLLPVLPLDGGRIAAALISLVTKRPGERPAHVLSIAVGVAGAAAAALSGNLFSAMFAGFLVAYNVGQLSAARNQVLAHDLARGWLALASGDAASAAAAARAALADRPSREVMTSATELLAWALARTDGPDAADEALRRIPHGAVPGPAVVGAIAVARGQRQEAVERFTEAVAGGRLGPHGPALAAALTEANLADLVAARAVERDGGADAVAALAVQLHEAGRFDEASRAGELALGARPSNPGRVAYNLACSQARAGNGAQAIWWLERAVDDGFADLGLLDRDPDLAAVRAHETFAAVRRRIGRG